MCSLTAKKDSQKGQLSFTGKISSSKMICNVGSWKQTALIYKEFFKYGLLPCFDGQDLVILGF